MQESSSSSGAQMLDSLMDDRPGPAMLSKAEPGRAKPGQPHFSSLSEAKSWQLLEFGMDWGSVHCGIGPCDLLHGEAGVGRIPDPDSPSSQLDHC